MANSSKGRRLAAVMDMALEAARDAFFDEFGYESTCPTRVKFSYSRAGIPEGKVAWWEPASAWSPEEVRIDPAFSEPEVAIVHEAIHVVLNSPCSGRGDGQTHGPDFHKLADRLGLPEQFRH